MLSDMFHFLDNKVSGIIVKNVCVGVYVCVCVFSHRPQKSSIGQVLAWTGRLCKKRSMAGLLLSILDSFVFHQ